MGKDLKGNELGPNLSQRSKDGYYRARFVSHDGKRIDRIFEKLKDAKRWLEDAKYEDAHMMPVLNQKTSVNEWFETWIRQKELQKRPNTVRNYRNRYYFNIQPVIGRMAIVDVKTMHCQEILDAMQADYATSTIKQTFITMQSMFYAAFENDVVRKSPITKNVVVPEGEEKKEIDFFTVEEQKLFMQVAKDYAYYEQFAIMLLTGLRISEVVGLTWDCIDLEKKTLKVEKILEYRYQRRIDAEKSKDDSARKDGWAWGPPKTKSGKRTIKLSSKAVEILERLKDRPYLKDTTPEEFRDLVFLSKKDGLPVKNNTYDNAIRKRIDIMTAEINEDRKKNELEPIEPHYLSCHDFRHTFATRYIESAKSENYAKIYKSLSQMMGHSSIKITLDLYSHLTDDTVDEIMSDFDLLMNTIM